MKNFKFCSIENDYGRPAQVFQEKWDYWRRFAIKNVKNLQKFEIQYDLETNYEHMPKLKKIADILQEQETQF